MSSCNKTISKMHEGQEELGPLSMISYNYNRSKDKPINKIVLQPYYYLESNPGKGLRERIAETWNHWLKVPADKLVSIRNIVEILQNCSIMFDDIEDSSTVRRGIPTTHNIYGVGSTLSAACLATHNVLSFTMDFIEPEETGNIIELILQALRGQGMELYWRDHDVCPTVEEYKEMVLGKTGMFFKMIASLMQMHSAEKINMMRFSEILGIAYQIVDDYKNLTSEEYMKTKCFCEDITEGKFSFPILYAIHSHPEDHQILDILHKRTSDRQEILRCLSLIEKYGGFEYTRNVISELREEAMQEIEKLGRNPTLERIVEDIFTNTADDF